MSFLKRFTYLFTGYEYTVAVFQIDRKRASDPPITGDGEPLCGCWDLNSGPLEERAVL